MRKNLLLFGKGLLLFKQWTNKGFSVFTSLKRNIKVCTLLVGYSIISLPVNTFAQVDTTKTINSSYELDCIVVVAKRTPEVYSEAARVIEVIPKTELENCPAQDLNELLEYAAGLDVRQRGSHGVQADISIRGGTFDQVLVLINGIPLNDPQTGHHNFNLPIDLSFITRVEILEGPGSRIFGPNAFTGAINIVTSKEYGNKLRASIAYGEHGLVNTGANLNLQSKRIFNNLSFKYKSSDGYIENTDFESISVFYNGDLEIPYGGNLSLQAGYLDKSFGANSFYTAKFPKQYEQIRNKQLALLYNWNGRTKIDIKSYWRRNHDRFELFREDRYQFSNGFYVTEDNDTASYAPGIYYPGHNYHMTDVMGGGVNVSRLFDFGKISIGSDIRYEKIFSNVLGNDMNNPIPTLGEDRGEFTKEASRNYLNIFAEYVKRIDDLYISGGSLFNYSDVFGPHVYSGAELSYDLPGLYRIFTSVNQSLRIPTFTDLYYNGPSNYGNPDLKPEKAISYELGIKRVYDMHKWSISGFYRNGRDVIDWVKNPSDEKYTTINHTKLNTKGIETSFRWTLKNVKFLKNIMFNYSLIDVEKASSDSLVSAYVLDHIKHKGTLSFKINIFKNIGLIIYNSIQDRNGSYTNTDGNETEYDPFYLLDTRLYWKKKKFNIYLECANLLDVEYRDIGFVQMPGRWLKIGLSIDLELDKGR